MAGYGSLLFVATLLYLGSINALSAEDKTGLKEALRPFFMQCAEEFGITEEQFEEAKKKGSNADIDPCFISCLLKKAEFFDSKGMFDVEKTVEFNKANLKSEEAIKFLDVFAKDCAKVNDEEVSDGEEGCERAKLLFECLQEHKKKLKIED